LSKPRQTNTNSGLTIYTSKPVNQATIMGYWERQFTKNTDSDAKKISAFIIRFSERREQLGR